MRHALCLLWVSSYALHKHRRDLHLLVHAVLILNHRALMPRGLSLLLLTAINLCVCHLVRTVRVLVLYLTSTIHHFNLLPLISSLSILSFCLIDLCFLIDYRCRLTFLLNFWVLIKLWLLAFNDLG